MNVRGSVGVGNPRALVGAHHTGESSLARQAQPSRNKEDKVNNEINEDMAQKIIEGKGYSMNVEVMPGRGEFVATAYKTLATGQIVPAAQALGRTAASAAATLVKVVTRP